MLTMSRLTVGSKAIFPDKVAKIHPDWTGFVIDPNKPQSTAPGLAIRVDGADNILLRIGEDTYLASAREMDLRGIEPGMPIDLDGKKGQVVYVDNESHPIQHAWSQKRSSKTSNGRWRWVMMALVTGIGASYAWVPGTKLRGSMVLIFGLAGAAIGGLIGNLDLINEHVRRKNTLAQNGGRVNLSYMTDLEKPILK